MVVVGKTIGGGVPSGAFGMTPELADRVPASVELEDIDVGGVGGTLAGNALSLAPCEPRWARCSRTWRSRG